jgi:inosine-uridine nucleoside N-ribohydrolase
VTHEHPSDAGPVHLEDGGTGSCGRARFLVDCDPGQDDAIALAVAAHAGEIVGVTTVGGNAPLADVTRNALLTCQLFGIDAPVHAGSARPLVAPPRFAPEIHGVSGFGSGTLPELHRTVASTEAVLYLIDTIRAQEGLWIASLGPMTNIALALRLAPDIAHRIAGISFMGGSGGVGNHTPVGEFNVLVDPEAAAIVLGSGVPLRMAGLDLTHQFVLDDAFVQDLRELGTTGAAVMADLGAGYLDTVAQHRGSRTGGLHDPCAIIAVTHPALIEATPRHVEVELHGATTRGMTVVDRRGPGVGAEPNVLHGHRLDHAAARSLVMEAIRARSLLGDQPVASSPA